VTTLPAANEPAPLDEHNRAFWLEPSLLPALVVAWRVLRAGSARAASMLALAGFRQRNIPDHDKCRVNAQAPDHLAVLLWAEPDQCRAQAHLNLAVSDADHHLERHGTADAAVQAVSRKLGGAVLLGCAKSSPADDSVVYPVLSDDVVATLRRYGTVREATAGQVLYSPADDRYDLILVLSGGLEVAYRSHGRNVLLAQPGPGQFAGELNLLTGQRPFVTVRVRASGLVIAVAPGQLRELLAREGSWPMS
jgi:hypothetical protein